MSKNIIKIIVSLGIAVLLGTFVYVLPSPRKQNQEQQTISPASTATSTATSTPTKRKLEVSEPVDRQNRIDHVLATKEKDYTRYSLTKDGPKNLIITYYQINLKNLHAEDIELRRHQQGVLVFEERASGEIQLIWESTDNISMTRPLLAIRDLTGDGVNEIVAMWQNGASEILYIYKFNDRGKTFELITPLHQAGLKYGSTAFSPVFNGPDSATQIIDLDNDGVPEVTLPGDEDYKAYKWNGTKYFLWKEQKEPFIKQTQAA